MFGDITSQLGTEASNISTGNYCDTQGNCYENGRLVSTNYGQNPVGTQTQEKKDNSQTWANIGSAAGGLLGGFFNNNDSQNQQQQPIVYNQPTSSNNTGLYIGLGVFAVVAVVLTVVLMKKK